MAESKTSSLLFSMSPSYHRTVIEPHTDFCVSYKEFIIIDNHNMQGYTSDLLSPENQVQIPCLGILANCFISLGIIQLEHLRCKHLE